MPGQIIQRGERTFLVRVFRGRDANGKRVYHNKTIRGSKKDAQRYATKAQREIDTGTFLEPTRESVAEYLTRWLDSAAKGRVRARTLSDYRAIVKRYIEPAIGPTRLSQLRAPEIQKLYTDMQERGLSPRTVRYAHAVLRNALGQAVKWGLLHANPALAASLPQQQRREMATFTPAQARTFLEKAEVDRFHALWVLLVTTGLRPGEALALRWSDYDGERVRVQRTLVRRAGIGIRFEEPKTDRSRRSVPLTTAAVRALTSHRKRQAEDRLRAGTAWQDEDLIFANRRGAPLDWHIVSRDYFKPLLARAELPRIRPYDLRHTCATLLLAAGENPKVVSERLGHATITLTLDTYTHVLPDMQQAATERMERLLG
jgi:integrase